MRNLTRNRIIVALDVSSQEEAINLVLGLKDYVGLFKIGLEFLNSVGIDAIQGIIELGGQIFLDGKFHDIPNTVAGASAAVTRRRVKMFNVHAMGGLEMMKLALESSKEEAAKLNIERPIILGVTILTSIDQKIMNQELGISGDIKSQVIHLAKLAEEAGLDGVIASPQEIEAIASNISKKMLIVTPGIRPSWSATQDQKRITTPAQAIIKGASYLVIGRPITKPPSNIGTPIDAAKLIEEEISAILKERI